MNGYLRQKTNQPPTLRGPNERVTHLDWILSNNIDKSHITIIITSCPKLSGLTTQSSLLTNDMKWKRFSAKTVPKSEWSQLGNTGSRSRFVKNIQKSHDEGQDFVHYASNALPVKKGLSSYLWHDNPEHDYARRDVQSCTDIYGVSCRQYADDITNHEALHASAAAKSASEIIDEIGLHTEKCKPSAA